MLPDLYTRYADWWPLLSPPEDYVEDAAAYSEIINQACRINPREILEIGSGGGSNAFHMKQHFTLTLCDLSPAMLRVSRKINPECKHLKGDMRTLRLKREFDAVFIHDAISYMRTLRDLHRTVSTAFRHCRSGGAAVFVPDYTKETFRDATYHGGYDKGKRSLRYLQWDHDPNPHDTTYRIDFAYLFSDAAQRVRIEHETHTCGLFSIKQWLQVISAAGFQAESVTIETDQLEPGFYRIFLGKK